MTAWRWTTIGELGTVVTGSTPPSMHPNWFGDELPFITPSDMVFGERRPVPERMLSEEGRVGLGKRVVPPGSSAFVCIGATIGKVCLLDSEAVTNQQINSVVPNDTVDPRFVYSLLRYAAPTIALSASGAATPIINKTVFSSINVRVPDQFTQSKIGEVLGSIDDLIESNRRRVELLEQMARTIYREWFVHFRYPGHEDVPLVDSALGPIPQSWEGTTLGALATVNGQSRKPADDEVIKYLDISSLTERGVGALDSIPGSAAPGRARRVLRPGDTVWATVRPNRRAHALVVQPEEDWIASTGLAVLTPKTVSASYLFELSSSTEFSDWLISRATGSAYPAVRAMDFLEAPAVRPDPKTGARFDEVVVPLHQHSWVLRNEASRLGYLRDMLLPKLVTGQIDVSELDLDALVSETVAS